MEKSQKTSFSKRKREKFDTKKKFGEKVKLWKKESSEIDTLKESYQKIDSSKVERLSDFPLSEKTQKGLQHAKFKVPTKIQQQSIGLALIGKDVLGAAKTGSGKTLAFLIPVLECLFHNKWTPQDGLGALIISPTRELAYQIFEVLRKIGKFHEFSAGLVIGGKHVREEAERINTTNIVICTPGRLLQHMDETAYFHADNLQMLVLDEADRILDLGFQQTMNAIVENLPKKRQTLLFSATQTKSVRDLARLSLKDPMYVSVHENAQHCTPTQLEQSYMVCPLEDKVSLVWSFVKHHLKAKTLIFMASCKQVRFIHEVFRRLRPGVPVMALHGAMQQMKRMSTYNAFCRKEHAVLIATDIAARGLDFPAVHWVLQLDCPEDANTYIHRAGRTARYEKNGEALLVLLPSEEEAMVSQLTTRKIPINKIKVNPKKQRTIQGKMEAMVAGEVQLKEFAQRAFVSYLKSVFYMSNKAVFDVTKVDLDALARSYGLALTPRVRFIEREKAKRETQEKKKKKSAEDFKNKISKLVEDKKGSSSSSSHEDDSSEESSSSDAESTSSGETSDDDLSGEDSKDSDTEENKKLAKHEEDGGFGSFEDEANLGDIFKVKRTSSEATLGEDEEDIAQKNNCDKKKSKALTKYAAAKKVLKKNLQVNTKIEFTEDGEEVVDIHRKRKSKITDDNEYVGGINIEQAKLRLQEEDKIDKALYRDKIKQKHKEEKRKEKEKRRLEKEARRGAAKGEEKEAVLRTQDSDEEDGESDSALDFLPDPDKVYGPQVDDDEASEAGGEDGWDSAEYDSDGGIESPSSKRRKYSNVDDSDDESGSDDEESDEDESDDDSDQEEVMNPSMSLADDEMMALKLLQGT